jgi:hypothetical protein
MKTVTCIVWYIGVGITEPTFALKKKDFMEEYC